MINLTEGKPYKILIRFALPIFLGSLLQQVYSFTDMAIIGQFVGMDALAGVGGVSSLDFFILGFVIGTASGFGIPIARSFGAKDHDKIRKLFGNAIWISLVCGILLTVLISIFIDPILSTLQLPENIYGYSKTYIATYTIGLVGIFIYNLLAAVLRSVGDSKTPLYFLILASALNIILDLIFVLVFNWGVFGTALATVISQSFSAVLCIILIYKKFSDLKPTREDLKPNLSIILHLSANGFPMGLQFSITAIGSMILQSAVNLLGTPYIAAISAGGRIHMLLMKGLESIGVALAAYTSQNLGANKIDRIGKGVRDGLIVGMVFSIMSSVFLLFASRPLTMLFIDSTETIAIDASVEYLNLLGIFYFLLLTLHIFRNTVQGLSYAGIAVFAGVAELLARFFSATVLVTNFGFFGAVIANPVAWIAADIFLIVVYLIAMKRIRNGIIRQ